ncbi:carboxymuconolactone decarboxylase family protein [Noviherbaspirillum suwonense]|uniref:4-carboxymuconolactone decarboxylase n=1 Tax=Noviherbaspirillum suwonense TaxID=1224511 RepID=A0ABY1QL67_9BURK|nr:carboxymuconolactone decarboxylase family protein [Noviherbaspirillum suwonense]SMP74538.1 4-carboxymuconolactone decarboxylase [Noviherbaspirillum suwonense]
MNLPEEFNTPEFAKGLAKRIEVLGEAHVQKSLDNVDAFNKPIQKFVTEAAWGGVWGRDGLDAKSRSMITVAMLTALGRQHELAVHVRGAINNGVSARELQEILLQSAIYAGAPAALEAFRTAGTVLKDAGVEIEIEGE